MDRWIQGSLLLATALCGACGGVPPTLDTAATAPLPLGTVQTRTMTIEVYAGPQFRVFDDRGTPLTHLATVAELRSAMPDLYTQVQHMLALDHLHASSLDSQVDQTRSFAFDRQPD